MSQCSVQQNVYGEQFTSTHPAKYSSTTENCNGWCSLVFKRSNKKGYFGVDTGNDIITK